MSILLYTLNDIFSNIIYKIKKYKTLLVYRYHNKNSEFDNGVVIYNSEFRGFNKIFQNTYVINSTIDLHSYIQENSRINNAIIGKFCSIGPNVSIGPGIHNIDSVSTHPSFYSTKQKLVIIFSNKDDIITNKQTTIGNDVWIGINAIILDGINVADGAIIAAGSVVTKNVLPYEIVAGVPAKPIKKRFGEKIIQELQHSKWWNNSNEWFKDNLNYMESPKKLINHTNKTNK